MRKVPILFLIAAAFLLASCGAAITPTPAPPSTGQPALPGTTQEEPNGTIVISGAFALYPMMTRWSEEFTQLHPNVKFDISGGGAGKGMTDVLAGAVDIGMVSRDVRPEEEEQGAYGIAVTKDAVFPVVNAQNPVLADIQTKGMSQETFIKIYITGEITTWGQVVGNPDITDEIHIYTRSDAAGAPEMWAKFLGDKVQEDLLGIGVNADPGVLEAVLKDPLGIGYNNMGYAFDLSTGSPVSGVVVVPIDLDQDGQANGAEKIETLSEAVDAVSTGKYPSPPARPLNVVTKGKPAGLVQAFIQWILEDGQAYVTEAGFVQLTPEQLVESIEKVR